MKRNKWFKHYNNASEGLSLRALWDSGEFEAYGLFWQILELISLHEDPERRGVIVISERTLCRKVGWNLQRLRRVLSKLLETSCIKVETKLDESLELSAPNWLKFQEIRQTKNIDKTDEKRSRYKKKEERSKKKESIAPLAVPNELAILLSPLGGKVLGEVKAQSALDGWLKEYELDSLATEINAAAIWAEDNRWPKNAGTFLNNWFKSEYSKIKKKMIGWGLPKLAPGEGVTW